MKLFSKWTIEDVEETFQLVLQNHHEQLTAWMTPHQDISKEEKQQLTQLRDKLVEHVWDWNEEELKVYFIIPLLNLVNFEQKHYKPCLDRELSMTFQDKIISGRVDFLVASGKRSPKRPFFSSRNIKKNGILPMIL